MLERLAIALGVIAAIYLAYRVWRLPPRRISRMDLAELGITGPVIVQFSTELCSPCKATLPELRDTARAADVEFSQIDVGRRPEVARRYGIRTVPTIVVAGSGGRVLGVWTSIPPNGEIADAARRAKART